MANAMLDARQEHGAYCRVELIAGQRRRCRWTTEEKVRIVAESFEEGANMSEVARLGVVRGLLSDVATPGNITRRRQTQRGSEPQRRSRSLLPSSRQRRDRRFLARGRAV